MPRPLADRRRYEIQPEIHVEWEVFRSKMRRRREQMGLTQAELSEAMGRSQDFVSYLENSPSFPSAASLMLWSVALGGTLEVRFE